jgi:hypothetical protein
MKKLFSALVVSGIYAGYKGLATPMNDYGYITIYFNEENLPYRICLKYKDIKYLD